MRIGVIGDIHGNYSGLVQAVQQQEKVIHWWFTGDGYREIARAETELRIAVTGVAGNCDFYTEYPDEQLLQQGKYRILLAHGHQYGVKQGYTRLALAGETKKADLIVFGHTHLPLDELWRNIRLFNPGSLSAERSLNGPSYGIIELTETGIQTSFHRL